MKKQNFLKGSLILMLSVITAKILGAFFRIPLTNMLGGVGMSYFSCAYSLFMPIYALTVTGLSAAVSRMTAQNAALGMYENARRVRQTAIIIFSLAGLAGSVFTALLAEPFCIYAVRCPEAVPAVRMIAPSVFFGCITAVERGYYEGLSNMYPTALSQLAEALVKVCAGLFLCGFVTENSDYFMNLFPSVSDIRALSAAAGILGVTLSSAGAALFFGVVRIFGKNKAEKESEKLLIGRKEIAHGLISAALPTGISSVVTNLTGLIDMETIIGCIAYFGAKGNIPDGISSSELPDFIYGSFAGIALTVFNLVPSVTNMLGKGILPSVTEAWESRNLEKLRSCCMQALLMAAVISIPSAIGMVVLSSELLNFLFPNQSDEVSVCMNALRLLMPAMVFLCLTFPLFSMLQAIGKASAPMKIMLAGAVLKLVGNLILIPVIGVNGAAFSTSLSYAAIFAASLRIFLRETGVKLSFKPFVFVIYAGALCGAAAYVVSGILSGRNLGSAAELILPSLCGGAVYFASLFICSSNLLPFMMQKEHDVKNISSSPMVCMKR